LQRNRVTRSSLQVSPTSVGFDATVGGVEPRPQQLEIVELADG
jgi:hypothetical protein